MRKLVVGTQPLKIRVTESLVYHLLTGSTAFHFVIYGCTVLASFQCCWREIRDGCIVFAVRSVFILRIAQFRRVVWAVGFSGFCLYSGIVALNKSSTEKYCLHVADLFWNHFSRSVLWSLRSFERNAQRLATHEQRIRSGNSHASKLVQSQERQYHIFLIGEEKENLYVLHRVNRVRSRGKTRAAG